MGMFFLTPEQQAAKDAEEARLAAKPKPVINRSVNYNPNPQPTARGSIAARDASGMTPTAENPLPHLSEEEKAAMIAERKRKEKEEEERKERERLEAIEAEKQRVRDSKAANLAAKEELKMTQARGLAPTYRESYDAEDPQTFKDAKQAADETYMQFWYDKANAITDKWTDEDYKLLVEEEYETYRSGTRNTEKTRRKYPEGYEQFLAIKERIDHGVLDFTSEEDHKKLIGPPSNRGYGKYQTWISKDNPLRQAVDAQSAVMKEWLDEANVDLVIPYEDLDGFKRPDPMRGEGIYLNTGTGAHIDWDSGRLKRMQSYRNVGGEEGGFGEYSTAFIRPDPDYGTFGKVLTVVGTLTGNPVMRNIGVLAQGGDWKDIAKSYLAAEITAPVLEETFATLGVDAELLGVDPETFTDSMGRVQTEMLEGKSGTDALLGEFTGDIRDRIIDTVQEALPSVGGIDVDTPDIIENIGDFALAGLEAVENFVKPVAKTVVEITQPISDVTSDIEDLVLETGRVFDDEIIQPVVETGRVFDDEIIQPTLEFGENVVNTFDDYLDTFGEEVIDPALQAGKEFGENIIEPIDNALDTFGEEVVDPTLQAGSDVLSEVEDGLKEVGYVVDDLVDWEKLLKGALGGMIAGGVGGMGSQQSTAQRTPTQTEDLFDRELFQFDLDPFDTTKDLLYSENSRKYG